MERGPLALFGAIIAVGLGPALWMGVQLGVAQQGDPVRPPTVGENAPAQNLLGGVGAGAQVGDDTKTRDTVPSKATDTSPSPSPSATPTRVRTTPPTTAPTSEAPTTDPATSEPSVEETETTEPTTDPTDPATSEPPADEPTDPDQDQPDGDDDWWTDEDPGPQGDYGNYASSERGGR